MEKIELIFPGVTKRDNITLLWKWWEQQLTPNLTHAFQCLNSNSLLSHASLILNNNSTFTFIWSVATFYLLTSLQADPPICTSLLFLLPQTYEAHQVVRWANQNPEPYIQVNNPQPQEIKPHVQTILLFKGPFGFAYLLGELKRGSSHFSLFKLKNWDFRHLRLYQFSFIHNWHWPFFFFLTRADQESFLWGATM